MSAKPHIIGGMLGLAEPAARPYPPLSLLRHPHLRLVNARSALRLLIAHCQPTRVWLPAYLCPALLEVIESREQVQFFDPGPRLDVAASTLPPDVAAGEMLVVIDYFGLGVPRDGLSALRRRGVTIVLDACQALFTSPDWSRIDYVIASPRKFVGVPDGGLLVASEAGRLPSVALHEAPVDWSQRALDAARQRAEFDRDGIARAWFQRFQQSEAEQPVGPFAMSAATSTILDTSVDEASISEQRRDNYQFLLGELADVALFREWPAEVVPLGFPIRLAARDRVRQALFAEQIYPPVHWRLEGSVPDRFVDCLRLSTELLTLPCDQRYTADDMRRMASIVRRELSS